MIFDFGNRAASGSAPPSGSVPVTEQSSERDLEQLVEDEAQRERSYFQEAGVGADSGAAGRKRSGAGVVLILRKLEQEQSSDRVLRLDTLVGSVGFVEFPSHRIAKKASFSR